MNVMLVAVVLCLLIHNFESYSYQRLPSFHSLKKIQSNAARSLSSSTSERIRSSGDHRQHMQSGGMEISAVVESTSTPGSASVAEFNVSKFKEGLKMPDYINGSNVRVGIISARWNDDIITGLYKGVNESLTKCGVKPSNVFTTFVPGSFELPVTAKLLAMSKRVDVIICLGCLIKGDTMHFEYIAEATAQGIMRVSLDANIPVIFGVLTVLNKEQAIYRSVGEHNEGLSWGLTAVEMGLNRMSALGMDPAMMKKPSGGAPYAAFNSSALPSTKNETEAEGNSTKKVKFF